MSKLFFGRRITSLILVPLSMNRQDFFRHLLGITAVFSAPRVLPAIQQPPSTHLYTVYVSGVQHLDWYNQPRQKFIRAGVLLTAQREPQNPFDRWAIALYTPQGTKLGYLPHWIVHIPAALMDSGEKIVVRVVKADPASFDTPWHYIKVSIELETSTSHNAQRALPAQHH